MRKEGELARTNDLLIRYQSQLTANEDDFFHGGYCINYVADVSGHKDFISSFSNSRSQYTFDEKKILEINPNSVELKECVDGGEKSRTPFQIFNKRFNIVLNMLESVLVGYKNYIYFEPTDEITNEIKDDVCNSPPRGLFTGVSNEGKERIRGEFPNLAAFVSEKCP